MQSFGGEMPGQPEMATHSQGSPKHGPQSVQRQDPTPLVPQTWWSVLKITAALSCSAVNLTGVHENYITGDIWTVSFHLLRCQWLFSTTKIMALGTDSYRSTQCTIPCQLSHGAGLKQCFLDLWLQRKIAVLRRSAWLCYSSIDPWDNFYPQQF